MTARLAGGDGVREHVRHALEVGDLRAHIAQVRLRESLRLRMTLALRRRA